MTLSTACDDVPGDAVDLSDLEAIVNFLNGALFWNFPCHREPPCVIP